MMDVKKWEEARTAWENVRKQGEIDIEQANLYLKAIDEKLNALANSIDA